MGPAWPRARCIIAVGGGKGGVGKSVVAANLAVAMAQMGKRTLVFDADLGAANLHTMFGIDRPGPGLQGFIARVVDSLDEAVVATNVPDLYLVPGSAGIPGCANIMHSQKQRVLRALYRLDYDVVVIDVGAGVAYNALDFFDAADLRLVVMAPQLTSIQNAYAFLKSAVFRVILQLGQDRDAKAKIAKAQQIGGPTAPVSALVDALRQTAPDLVPRVEAELTHFGCRIVGNYVFQDAEMASLMNIGRLIRDYLRVHAPLIGALRAQRSIHDSVNRRVPLLLSDASSRNARELKRIARMLASENVARLRELRAGAPEPPPERQATGPIEVVDALV